MIKWIELNYNLREIRHMFYPDLLFLNSVNSSFKLQQPSNQRMCACKMALNRRCKAKICILSSRSLTRREVKTATLDSDSSIGRLASLILQYSDFLGHACDCTKCGIVKSRQLAINGHFVTLSSIHL